MKSSTSGQSVLSFFSMAPAECLGFVHSTRSKLSSNNAADIGPSSHVSAPQTSAVFFYIADTILPYFYPDNISAVRLSQCYFDKFEGSFTENKVRQQL